MIVRTRNRGEVEYRAFALTDMTKWGYNRLRNFGSPVNPQAVRGLPAIHRAARIRAEALASLRLRCWRGEAPTRQRVDTVWQARLFNGAANEYQSRFEFWETVGESLAYRGNAYIWKNVDPLTLQVVDWYALHPDQVRCDDDGDYVVKVMKGYLDPVGRGVGEYDVDQSTILHIRGHGEGGKLEAPSPIQVFRDALQSPLARQRYERNMWEKGANIGHAVVFPPGVPKEQADEWKDNYRANFEGTEGETTLVLGGGATVQPIGMTAKDAEFIGLAHLTVEDASRIMGVPTDLLDLKIGERTTPGTLEDVLTRWYRFGLGPELNRIEAALQADQELFGNGARTIPGFEAEGVIRGDVKTEDDIAHQRIQDGRLLVDEWRESAGLEALPNGWGKIPQIVPVGGGQNPNAPAQNQNGNGEETPAAA